MKFKINQGQTDQSSSRRKNNIFKRFTYHFSILLGNNRNRQQYPRLESIYVKNKAVHEGLKYFSESEQNQAQFLIGFTGIGKSTSIRGFFQIEKSKAEIRGDTLLLPIFIDGASLFRNDDIDERLGALFWNGCKEVRNNNPDITYDKEELYDFIYENSPQTLGRFENIEDDSKEATINNLSNKSKRSYSIELLKYYLCQVPIKKVVLVIDDVDSIKDTDLLKEFIHLSVKSWECLQNNESGFFSKILIAERPETHRNLLTNESWFSAFGFTNQTININEAPDLVSIFQKRFDYLTGTPHSPKIKNHGEWKDAYNVLMSICNDLVINNQNIILSLLNFNVRDSLSLILELLTSGFWLQKDKYTSSYFKIDHKDFRNPKSILILKSIGYKNNEFFINSEQQNITNILHTKRGCEYSFLPLQIISSFVAMNVREDSRFLVYDKTRLIKSFKLIIEPRKNQSLDESINNAIEYLISKEVLRISSKDSGEGEKLYLSPKGEILWQLLSEHTILLEMFRDDLWLELDKHINVSIRYSPYSKKISELSLIACEYIEYERNLVNLAKSSNSLQKMKEILGEDLPSIHIGKGIVASSGRLYPQSSPVVVQSSVKNLVSKMTSLTNAYNRK